MTTSGPVVTGDSDASVDAVVARVGRNIVLGLPLGLGKPLRFVNALYHRARTDPSLNLHIVTGLSMQVPQGSSSLERRFLEPIMQRLYGAIPDLEYARDAATGALPDNVKVSEFFFQAGSFLNQTEQQRNYVCTNYTHAVRDLMAQGINVIAQMVAPAAADSSADTDSQTFSLSSNPDLTLDLIPLLRQCEAEGMPVALVAETNRALPYMGNDAVVPVADFDVILDDPASDYPLFSVPQTDVSPQDHLIGFYASTLLRDGGTLQVGIGSLGTALVHSTILRHKQNSRWRQLYGQLEVDRRFPLVGEWGGSEPFREGLYGCSEMMMEGFIHLMEAGVLTREVHDDVMQQEAVNRGEAVSEVDPGQRSPGVVMHGGFFLGSQAFYEKLRRLSARQREQICMTSVNFINDLCDHRFGNQRLKLAQRVHSRFINSAMMQTLNGAAVSDALEDARVVSGVGGQYNFVAMAHDLPGARSILTLRSTREEGGKTVSNILFSYGHCTIPRHLRDIVITEYGIADLRGQPDEEVYCRLIAIADARFQRELLEQAQQAGKISPRFELPAPWQNNTPGRVEDLLAHADHTDLFPAFPFGHDFTEDELVLGKALKSLKAATATPQGKALTVLRALWSGGARDEDKALLLRMGLEAPEGASAWLEKRLLSYALRATRASG